jgi:hypothetical protein
MVYSLGNRYSWLGPVELYMNVESILCSYNYKLKHIESCGGMFCDYFRMTREYVREALIAIETALDDDFLDLEIEGELIDLKRVFKGGGVIMG